MSKAEKFIKDCTRNCSNELCAVEDRFGKKVISYHEWLTPDQALKAVEIAKEEIREELLEGIKTDAFQYIKEHIKHCSNISHNNIQYGSIEFTQPWLTLTEARRAVIIAEDNIIEKAAKWIGTHLLSASCGEEQIKNFYKDMKEI